VGKAFVNATASVIVAATSSPASFHLYLLVPGAVLVTRSYGNGKDETRVARVQFPLRAANLSRKKLVFPLFVSRLIFVVDHFPNPIAFGIRNGSIFRARISRRSGVVRSFADCRAASCIDDPSHITAINENNREVRIVLTVMSLLKSIPQ